MEDVVNEDIFSGQLNQALTQAVARGTSALKNVPALLKKIIKDGLESSFVDLSILCEKDPEALELLNNEWRKGSPELPEKIDLSEIGVEDHREAEECNHEQENA
jgi:hypothetical protein